MASQPADNYRISVEGLKEARRALNNVEAGLGKELGQAGKAAADIVAKQTQPKVPVLTGRARDSVRAVVSQGGGGVRAGGAKAPHYGWLDFGGRVGRNKSVSREVIRGGRYIYPALAERSDDVLEQYESKVNDLLRRAGLK